MHDYAMAMAVLSNDGKWRYGTDAVAVYCSGHQSYFMADIGLHICHW